MGDHWTIKKGTRWMPENLVAGAGFEPTASGL